MSVCHRWQSETDIWSLMKYDTSSNKIASHPAGFLVSCWGGCLEAFNQIYSCFAFTDATHFWLGSTPRCPVLLRACLCCHSQMFVNLPKSPIPPSPEALASLGFLYSKFSLTASIWRKHRNIYIEKRQILICLYSFKFLGFVSQLSNTLPWYWTNGFGTLFITL